MKTSPRKTVFLTAFLISGMAALVFEVVWVRWFALVFGNTVFAVSTVLAAYMAGLALGSRFIGRFSDRSRNPLRLYALLELLIGVSALLVYPVTRAVEPLYAFIFHRGGDSQVLLTLCRFVLSFLILVVPTTLMGGTLPVLCRAFTTRLPSVSSWVGGLYFVNTIGAVLGCFLGGFVLLPFCGLIQTSLIASAAGILAGLLALHYAGKDEPYSEHPDKATHDSARPAPRGQVILVTACMGVTGFCALALEVIWTRLFLMIYGCTTYSFTIMLGIFLTGLALGAGAWGWVARKTRHKTWLLALLPALAGLLVLAGIPAAGALPHLFLIMVKRLTFKWSSFITIKAMLSFIILFAPAFCFGGMLPIASSLLIVGRDKLGTRIGTLYAANSVGAILGSVIAGFVMIPLLGTESGLRALGAILLALPIAILFASKIPGRKRLVVGLVLVAISACITTLIPGMDRDTISLGVYFRPQRFFDAQDNITLKEERRKQKLIFYGEGVSSTATIRQHPTYKEYFIDGKVEASTLLEDMRLQKMVSYLALLIGPEPHTALNVGLGSGITLSALGSVPLDRLDCVEVEPVIKNVAAAFSEHNAHILDHPALRIIIGDGRNYIKLTREKYDIITSDPFEPVVGGAAGLYTVEHFKGAAEHLRPGGCMTQFLPIYELFADDHQGIIKTFHAAFPHVLVWFSGGDTILMGFMQEPTFQLETIDERMNKPGMREKLEAIGLDSLVGVLGTFVMYLGPDDDPFPPRIRINTDNHPRVEFNAPKAHVIDTVPQNVAFLIANQQDFPEHLLKGWDTPGVREALIKRSATYCGSFLSGKQAFLKGDLAKSETSYRRCLSLVPGNAYMKREIAVVLHWSARHLLQRGIMNEAERKLSESLALGNDTPQLMADLSFAYLVLGKVAEAKACLQKAISVKPDIPKLLMIEGQILLAEGHPREAAQRFQKALENGGNPHEVKQLLTRARARLGTGK